MPHGWQLVKYPGSRHEPLHRLLGERMEILECLRTEEVQSPFRR
jgi:hypothetical protein